MALILLALAPVAGNALSLVVELPRRVGQTVLFGASLGFILYWLRGSGVARQFRSAQAVALLAKQALLAAVGLTILIAALPVAQGSRPDRYAVAAFVTTVAWLTAGIFALTSFFRPSRPPGHLPAHEGAALAAAKVGTLTVGVGLVGIAYAGGPDPGKVYMAFGGSPIVSGIGAAIITGLGLMLFDGWRVCIPVLCAAYLAFVGTARTTFLAMLIVVASISFADASGWRGRTRALAAIRRLALSLVTVGLCLVLVAVPARMWAFYPFLSSYPGQVVCVENRPDSCIDAKEYFLLQFRRWERLRRAILTRLGASIPHAEPARLGASIPHAEPALPSSLGPQAEARLDLVIKSVRTIARRPLGWWPRRFDEVMPMECGVPGFSQYLCGYPHNLILEIGFHYGWLPAVIVAAGLLAWGIQVVRHLGPGNATTIRVSGVAFLAWLTFAIVSGSLIDHLIPLLLGGIWLVLWWVA
ncbi:MAG: hypothetical protein QN209_13065, partial [Armatimonadota bacterium]|nr:hypothetical protein [Armatimonadota bacterium]